MNAFKDTIIQKIQSGEIDMTPKWYFVLRGLLLAVSLVVVAFVTVYLLSFILFALHQTGLLFAPTFGPRGFMFFLVSTPWLLILTLGMFLGLLYVLVTHYSFSYRKPLAYSMIGVVLFVTAVSSFIQQTTMHERMQAYAERHQVPGLVPLYKGAVGERPKGVVVGTVAEVVPDGFDLHTETEEIIAVTIHDYTKQPSNSIYVEGDMVMVFGKRNENSIDAFGIRRVEDISTPAFGKKGGPKGRHLNSMPTEQE